MLKQSVRFVTAIQRVKDESHRPHLSIHPDGTDERPEANSLVRLQLELPKTFKNSR